MKSKITLFALTFMFLGQMARAGETSLTVMGTISDDCSVSVGAPPDATDVGNILRNPQNQTIDVSVSLSCNSMSPAVSIKATNGKFAAENGGSEAASVDYTVSLEGENLQGSQLQGSQLASGDFTQIASMMSSTAEGTLKITPMTFGNVKPGTYTETFTLTLSQP